MVVQAWIPKKLWAQWLTVIVVVGRIKSPTVIRERRKRAVFIVYCTLLFSLQLRKNTEDLKATYVTFASVTYRHKHKYLEI